MLCGCNTKDLAAYFNCNHWQLWHSLSYCSMAIMDPQYVCCIFNCKKISAKKDYSYQVLNYRHKELSFKSTQMLVRSQK